MPIKFGTEAPAPEASAPEDIKPTKATRKRKPKAEVASAPEENSPIVAD